MVTLLIGKSGTGKTHRVLEALRADAAAGIRAYYIVPEQQTVACERKIADVLPPSAQLTTETVNFTRLADAIFRTYGGISYNYVRKSARPVLMWQAMRDVAPAMKEYGATLGTPGALATMQNAIRELKGAGVRAKDLSDAAEKLEAGSRRDRMLDLALLYAAYEARVEERFTDTDDVLASAAERLRGRDFFRGTHVYLDGFHGFSAMEFSLLSEIFRGAETVTVTLTADGGRSRNLFYSVERTAQSLRSLAARLNVPLREEHLREDHRHKDAALRYLCENLWDFSAPSMTGKTDAVRLYECADEFEECELLAQNVAKAVREGRRYGEIAVVARSAARYRGILESALERYRIPYYLSARTDVNKLPLIKLISSALTLKNRSFRCEDIIAYLKCGYTGFTPRQTDLFEKYLRKWNLSGRKFTEPDRLTQNPSGYREAYSREDVEILAEINDVRDKMLRDLNPFFAALRAAATSRAMCVAVYEFLLSLNVKEQIARDMEAKAEDPAAVDALRQLWSTITEALDVIAVSMGDDPISTEHFLLLLRTIFDDTDIGTIPPSEDCVHVGDASRMRQNEVTELFILGACDGEFPQAVRDAGFFSEADKIALEGEGIVLASREAELSADELLFFYTACAAPRDRLHISRRLTDFSGGERFPSSGYDRIRALLPDLRPVTPADPFDRILTPESALHLSPLTTGEARKAVLSVLGRAVSAPLSNAEATLSHQVAAHLFGGNLALTQSRIESFVKCHFDYCCRYVLKLKTDTDAEFRPVDIGNFVHRVLEMFLERVEQDGLRFADLDREAVDALADEVITAYVVRLLGHTDSVRMRLLFEKLKKNTMYLIRNLAEEFSQSAFQPQFFELDISDSRENTPSPLRIPLEDGTHLSVYGIADRVDTYRKDGKTYVRIVDYKTGSKDFNREDLSLGLNLQLLLYLFAVCRCDKKPFLDALGGEPTPAGVLYFSAKPPKVELGTAYDPTSEETARTEEEEIDKCSERKGILLSDTEILRAQDATLSMRYIPKTKVKDNAPVPNQSYATAAEFDEIYEQIRQVLTDIGTEMKKGDLRADPLARKNEDPCQYCRHKAVCRKART